MLVQKHKARDISDVIMQKLQMEKGPGIIFLRIIVMIPLAYM
jgi:hypothetical protein